MDPGYFRYQSHSACSQMMSITQLEMNMTSGQRVNPVNMEAAETRAANLVNILLKFILPRSIYANILIAAMLIKMEYYFYLRLVTQ
ncbi:Uncharacterised protein [Serratia quinivorans]|nr:Uncharacterised protein [Serratia quinivorans]CAI1542609.1 Uncharacterised protein [Serratia quinivorans]